LIIFTFFYCLGGKRNIGGGGGLEEKERKKEIKNSDIWAELAEHGLNKKCIQNFLSG
jgi:hypothetical protein